MRPKRLVKENSFQKMEQGGKEQNRIGSRMDAGSLSEKTTATKRPLMALLICVVALLAYYPTLGGDFILDDLPLIRDNPYIKTVHSVISYLTQIDGSNEVSGPGNSSTGYYRPLVNLTLLADYKLWGMDGSRFRMSNLLLHLSSSLLLFALASRLVKSDVVGFWAAILFSVHPANTEAVSWVSSRNNILATFLGLGFLNLYILSREKRRLLLWGLSALALAGALLSKEFGVVLLPVALLWGVLLPPQGEEARDRIFAVLPLIVLLCAYLLLRFFMLGFHSTAVGGEPWWQRIFLAPYLILLNTGIVFVPVNLHSFMVRYPTGPFPWRGILGFLFLLLVLWGLRRAKNTAVFRFGICSFLISLVPILNIIAIPSPSLVSMRWLYFPMPFLLLGISPFLLRLMQRRHHLATFLLCIVTGYLGLYTHVLNRNLWHDEKTFFTQEAAHFKNHYYSGAFAEILYQEGNYRGAEEHFALAVREGHATARDLINYGSLLTDQGKYDAACKILEKAERLPMSFEERAELHNNLGTVSSRLGRTAEAITHFKKAVIYLPKKALFWGNLAGAYGNSGDFPNSAAAFIKGLEIDPHSLSLRKGLALTFINMRNYTDAVSTLEEIPSELADGDARILLDESRSRLEHGGAREGSRERARHENPSANRSSL